MRRDSLVLFLPISVHQWRFLLSCTSTVPTPTETGSQEMRQYNNLIYARVKKKNMRWHSIGLYKSRGPEKRSTCTSTVGSSLARTPNKCYPDKITIVIVFPAEGLSDCIIGACELMAGTRWDGLLAWNALFKLAMPLSCSSHRAQHDTIPPVLLYTSAPGVSPSWPVKFGHCGQGRIRIVQKRLDTCQRL